MRRLSIVCLALWSLVARAGDEPIQPADGPPPVAPAGAPAVKVEFFWAERRAVPGITQERSLAFGESGERIYPYRQPVLTNKDIVKVDVNTIEFKGSTQAPFQFGVTFQLTDEARRRLAQTCPADGDGLVAGFVDGDHRGTAYYLKSRDSERFAPFWGLTTSRDKVERIVATFAAANAAGQVPISAANCDKLARVGEQPKAISRIFTGPKAGELVLYERAKSVEIVDDVNLGVIRTMCDGAPPVDFTLSRDGRFAAWNPRRTSKYVVHDSQSGKNLEIELGTSKDSFPTVGFAAFSPDNKLVAIGETFWSRNAEGEGTSAVKLFDGTGKLVRTLASPGPGTLTPVFSPDGKLLAVGNRNGVTQVFDVATGVPLHTLPRKMTHQLAFRPDGKVLAAGYVDGAVVLWDMATGQMLQSRAQVAKEVVALDWSLRGDVLVTPGATGKIVLWNPANLTPLKELEAPAWLSSIRFSADGTRLLAAGGVGNGPTAQRSVVVWAVRD